MSENQPPKSGLCRSVPFEVTRSNEDGEGLTLEGYAAVFNSPTRIDSWEGKFDETIRNGAFAKTIRETTPILQFDHGSHPLIGSIPIGSIKSLKEDHRGLFVKARLSDNWLVEPVRQAIADGAVTGMSFRFSVVREEWEENRGQVPLRILTEVRCSELGPVVWPAYRDTSVGVRSQRVLDELENPDVRAEVARALLSVNATDEASENNEELPETPDVEVDRIEDSEDAPRDAHPSGEDSEVTDAPPDSGHPSAAEIRRDAQRKAAYLALTLKGESSYE